MKPEIEKLFSNCTHCGLCLSACPTYRELGTEMDSPRGRIYLMRALAEGRLEPVEDTIKHLDLCLGCRACETACPSGVQYGRLLEASRADIEPLREQPLAVSLVKRGLVEQVLPYAGRTRAALGMASVGRLLSPILPGPLRMALELAPGGLSPGRVPSGVVPAQGTRRYRVGLITGCIASVVFGHINDATIEVLTRHGCEVVIPATQGCCGALHVHNGGWEGAVGLARQNIQAFGDQGLDAIITNAAGCGSTLKEYGHLLPEGETFAGLVRDISEWLVHIGLQAPVGSMDTTVTYQDACHLAHAQGIRRPPRAILEAIPGLKLVEMEDPDYCCGGAGVYNILQPDMSKRLLNKKVEAILATGANVVAAANPGCLMQIERGLRGRGIRLAHPIELLAEAYYL